MGGGGGGGDCFLSGRSTNSQGVAILLKNNFEYEILDCKTDDVGNYLLLVMKLYNTTINLLTIYGSNNDNQFKISSMKQSTKLYVETSI